MTSVSIVSRSLSAAWGLMIAGGYRNALNKSTKSEGGTKRAHRLHDRGALLLGLVLGEERSEEARLLLHVHVEIAVVVERRRGHLLGVVRLLGLAGGQPLGDDCHSLVAVEEVGVCRVHVARLHAERNRIRLSGTSEVHAQIGTYATRSLTSFVVGFIEVLKKLMTTELNRSRSAGKRLNACCRERSVTIPVKGITMTCYLLEDLCQDTNELVIDELATFQRWVLQSPDLLLDNDLERLCTDKQRRRRTG